MTIPKDPSWRHPTLEGHPAWEAFKRAPIDTMGVSAEEQAECRKARAGSFTTAAPGVRDVDEA